MAEPLSGEDFDLYYKNTVFCMQGEVYWCCGRVEPHTVQLKYGPGWEKEKHVDYREILDYVGIFPTAGYRNFSEFDVRYVSFTRAGTKKGPSREGIVNNGGGENPWREVFLPKYFTVEQAVSYANRGLLAAISPDLLITKQQDKVCLMWKGFCVGRVTKHNKAVLSKLYSFLVPIINDVIPVGDVR